MKPLRSIAFAASLSLLGGCVGDASAEGARVVNPELSASLTAGPWALTSVDQTALPGEVTRAEGLCDLLAGRLALESDHTWRLRYDYHVVGAPPEHVWSSGLSGTWSLEAGDPAALRVAVTDDRSTAVATLQSASAVELTLAGHRMRFERAPQ